MRRRIAPNLTPEQFEGECELRVTEYALRVLMDEIRWPTPRSQPSGNVHECSVCGRRDVWGPNWMWFGDADEKHCLKTCSRPCFEHVCRLEITNA